MEQLPLISLIAILAGFSLAALFAVLEALFPGRLRDIRRQVDRRPGRSFLIGLVNFLFFGALSLGFIALTENVWRFFLIPAVIIVAALSISLALGLSAVAGLVGARLFPEHSRFQQTLRGSLLWAIACLVPYIGWFGLLGYTTLVGFGGLILGRFSRPDPE